MTTYTILANELNLFIKRTISSEAHSLIFRLADAELMRRIRTLEMETDATISCASPDYHGDLPEGWLSFRHVFLADASNPRTTWVPADVFHTLNNIPGDQFAALLGDSSLFYTIEANKIKVNQPAGSSDPIVLNTTYFKRDGFVEDFEATSIILETHYDAYFNACLKEAWDYIDELEMVTRYTGKLDRICAQIEQMERTRRVGSGPMRRTNPTKPLA